MDTTPLEDRIDGPADASGVYVPPSSITYAELRAYRCAQLRAQGRASQVIRNHESHLTRWLAGRGVTDEQVIGPEFGAESDFNAALSEHITLAGLKSDDDRRSSLRAWRSSYLELLTASQSNTAVSLAVELRRAREAQGLSRRALAIRADVSLNAICRWEEGLFPNKKNIQKITNIESILALPAGALVRFIGRTKTMHLDMKEKRTSYGVKLSNLLKDPYWFHYDKWSDSLKREWFELLDFFTRDVPRGNLKRNSEWRLRDDYLGKISDGAKIRGRVCPTACFKLNTLEAFFGWFILERGNESQLSLSLLVDIEAIERYMDWQADRSGDITASFINFATFLQSLTRRNTGYLRQISCAVANNSQDEWDAICDATHARLREILTALDKKGIGKRRKSRDPKEPIQIILDMDQPARALEELAEAIDADMAFVDPCRLHGLVMVRNSLLVRMITANPLRCHQYAAMTYRDDNTGHLYRREDNNGNEEWRLRFRSHEFKNEKGAAFDDYDEALPCYLNDQISQYLTDVRPRLLKERACDALFLGKHGGFIPPTAFWKILATLSLTYISNYAPYGFGVHAVRHIVATHFLKVHPAAFPMVAQLLHDKLETVLREYGHLAPRDGLRLWHAQIEELRSAA